MTLAVGGMLNTNTTEDFEVLWAINQCNILDPYQVWWLVKLLYTLMLFLKESLKTLFFTKISSLWGDKKNENKNNQHAKS